MSEKPKDTEQVGQPQTEQGAIPVPKRTRRWWCRIGLILVSLILIPLIFLLTGKGQRTALELADKFLDELTIGRVEGSIQDGLTLSNTAFVTDGVKVEIGRADLHVGFGCLINREACLENVAIKDTLVEIDTSKLPPAQEEPEREPFTELNLPLGISAKNVSLDNIRIKVDETDITLNHFHSGVSGKGRALKLAPTEIEGLHLSFAPGADESVQEEGRQAVEKEENSANASADTVDWAALKAQLSEPLLTRQAPIKLPLDLAIPQFEAKNITLEQKIKAEEGSPAAVSLANIASVSLQANADEHAVSLARFEVKSDRGNVSGKGDLNLKGNYPLAWDLTAETPLLADWKIPASEVKATLSGELFGTTALNVLTKGAAKAELKGELRLAEPKTPLDLTLKGETLQYPFLPEKGEDPLKLQKAEIVLKGDLLDYRLNARVNVSGMGIPASSADLKGQGGITNFSVDDLTLNALAGKTRLAGKADWSQGVEWDSTVRLDGVHTQSLVPDWPAVLSGGLSSKGYVGRGEKGDDWSAEVSKIDLKGTLLQKSLQLKGDLKSNTGNLLEVPGATLIYGENTIAMKGVLSDRSDFSADIKAPNLQGLLPKLTASADGKVKLTGKVSEPDLDLDLNVNNLGYEQLSVNGLSAKGKVTTEKSIRGDLAISLKRFAYGDIKVENADLTANGSEANHHLKLSAKGNPVGANLQLSGKFDRATEVWSGQLNNVSIDTVDFGSFKTNQAVNVNYNNKQINAHISAHCWHNPKINLCFPQAFNAGQEGKVPFEIKNFNLAAVQEFLDKNSQISGMVNAKGHAAWFNGKAPQANVELTSNALKFVQKMDGGKRFPITLAPLKINADLTDDNLKLKTDLKIENNGRITTDLAMNDLSNARTLAGNINIDKVTLKLLRPLLNGGETVDGNLNARLTVAGSATSPLLNGALDLTELRARSHTMPFDVTGGNLALRFNGATSTLAGRIQTTESELRLDGDADWRNLEAWRTRVHAQANRFRVNVPNMAKVEFSPDVEVTATPQELILGGNIDIPWARIEVEELPETAVSVSDDEIIMDGSVQKVPLSQRQIPEQTSGGMAIKANVNIKIGDDVSLKAYGLKSNLNGNIAVRQGKQGLGLYGQVYLKRGRYASFGQDLIIRKGIISFAGLPSQPTLNIEAIRNPDAMEDSSVTAGVKVIGLASNPEVKVFSEPAMSQNEALSYVLTGRSLENSGDAGSSNSMAAALLSMSLSKSSKTVGEVGSTFGLKDLNVSTAGIGDNTKVEASASLSPKFRIKYGVGIFAALTELTLRYNLAPRLYLQWVSSVNQAVDLMYRFEFD